MRAVVQRVSEASVSVDGVVIGEIGRGLLVLLGVGTGDTEAEADWMAAKVARLRIFSDEQGRMNLNISEAGGDALVVSQFTLYGDARKGNRPSFVQAAEPAEADRLYRYFADRLEYELGRPVPTGEFGASMAVQLLNDGPVTIILER